MESIDQSKGHSQNKTTAINFLVSMLISCHMLFGRHWLEFTPSMQINAGLLAILLEKVRLDFKRKKTEGKVRASYTVGEAILSNSQRYIIIRDCQNALQVSTNSVYFLDCLEFK